MKERFEVVDDIGAAFAREVAAAYDDRADRFTIALSGGSTARTCYEALRRVDLDWGRTNVVWGDERCVALDHEDSNYLLASNALLDWISPPASVHPMGGGETPEAYEKILADLMPLDVVHLGMGSDGHTASLFPGSPDIDIENRLVIETGDDLHAHRRMTLTFEAIAKSRKVIFTVAGENKASMLARVRGGDDYPAARVTADEVVWLVDPPAAGRL